MANGDNTFVVTFEKFHVGAAPFAHLDSFTEEGTGGHYSAATSVDIITEPGILSQGPALTNLTAGTQAGALESVLNFILDTPVSDDATYGIGNTKLHKISSTAVTNAGIWPHAITGAQTGSSVHHFQGKVYYFYNKSSGADCGQYDLSSTFDDDYMSTVPTGAAALQKAPHPVASKQDIMMFGNGRYVGTFISTGVTLAPTKLDFGAGSEVADLCFHANQWWIAVNYGVTTGTNRASSNIYLYDGAALSALLTDEVAVGLQQIGFILPVNGVVYVAYKDLSTTGGYAIGYVAGRQLKALRYFTGSLPTFAQKTLYQNMIAFIAGGSIMTIGARTEQLPIQLSNHADAGYATVGAIAAPFGTVMVSSTDGGSNYRLAKFSGYDTACAWRSVTVPTASGHLVGYIDRITVLTRTIGSGGSCALQLETDQNTATSAIKTIASGKRRHVFDKLAVKSCEDFRVFLDWSGGSASNPAKIRKIIVEGHFVEKK